MSHPSAQYELKLHSILERRLAGDHRVAALYGNRVTLATRISTEAAQIGEDVIRARGTVDSDAEGHRVPFRFSRSLARETPPGRQVCQAFEQLYQLL
jgi:hypothetical protein